MQEADKVLLRKFIDKEFTEKEYERIQELLQLPNAQEVLEELTRGDWVQEESTPNDITPADAIRVKEQLFAKIRKTQTKKSSSVFRLMRYAAIFTGVVILAGLPFYFSVDKTEDDRLATDTNIPAILPGSDKAILRLGDGSTVSLSSADEGKIIKQDGIEIRKTGDGMIIYSPEKTVASEIVYNSLETPKGGQYSIILPDGSKAWLNAASSLTYPIYFNDSERRVKMSGEVYFEVAKLPSNTTKGNVPFVVETAKQEVQVLGTHFNVNAYADGSFTETTLIEGSVRVIAKESGHAVLLRPGQQALLDKQIRVQSANVHEKIAWKNGEFIFEKDALGNILKQLARWYDVEIDCPEHLQRKKFSGIVSRNMPLPTVIEMIRSTREINIEIKGRRLIVSE
ncbi:FecR family protein [Sphingobacterium haloxyli]|uniref:Anti-sigma factor n=1 Tax=Sphingobacterium haloxyli TaxID=2100533 RepID=A0A2S9J4V3_9SPHI|nr:FecR domain-containing protein [Sphingobacterium haloxyli]PRD47818.1 anti-sigma factor [Sphingobacterium haloxyli]